MKYSFTASFRAPLLVFAVTMWILLPFGVHAEDRSATNPPVPPSTTDKVGPAQVGPDAGQLQRASQHFRRGAQLFQEGAFEGALVEFQRAYQIAPNPGVLYNLAQTDLMLHDYAQAKILFERYLAQGAGTIPAERRALVEAELGHLRDRLGYAQLLVSPEQAEVWVDKRLVGHAPLKDAVVLNVGRHLIEVHAEGYRSETHTVEIAGGEEQKIDFRLTSLVSAIREVKRPVRSWLKPAWIGSLGLLGLAGGGAIVTGVLAARSHDDLQTALSTRPGNSNNIDKARERTRRLSHVSDALLGVGLLAAAGAATLLVLDMAPERPVRVAVGAGHVVVRGHF